MREIIFATNNAHKLGEVQALLGDAFSLVTLRACGITEDIPETAPTFEGNALQKSTFIFTMSFLIISKGISFTSSI